MNQKPIDKRKVTTNKSSIAHIAEQGIKLGKTIKKKANNILTNGYTNGLEQLIKSENYDESIYSNDLYPQEEEDKTKSVNNNNKVKKNVINFTKCFGIKRKNSKKKAYLSKVEATITAEEKRIADEYKAKEEQQLKELILQEKTSCATPTEIVNEVESHIDDDGAGIYNDVIGLYDNVVCSINALDSMEQDDAEWYDVVDLSSIDIPNYFVDGGKSNSDILHEEDEHDDIPFETYTVDDTTIGMENLSHVSADQMRFYDCPPGTD